MKQFDKGSQYPNFFSSPAQACSEGGFWLQKLSSRQS